MTKVAITCDVGKGIEVVRCGSEICAKLNLLAV